MSVSREVSGSDAQRWSAQPIALAAIQCIARGNASTSPHVPSQTFIKFPT